MAEHPNSVQAVVEAGLCIGCGLCEALAPDRFRMTYTPQGRLRPGIVGEGDEAAILAACPGAIARPNDEKAAQQDDIWGSYHRMEEAWAANGDVRYTAATGGVLTALGAHLLDSGQARFILHCEADPARPARTRWCMSETPDQVIRRAGSRYGPSDTLAGLEAALDRAEPFAIIAKPCDAGAVRARARRDPRLAQQLVAVLTVICGGASDLGKTWALFDEIGVTEDEVTCMRYRGYGNPGPGRVETADGRAWEKSYDELWGDEAGWRIQTRCKLCPDATGEAADIAAGDIYPGGNPSEDEDQTNGVITRTAAGEALYRSAVAAGALITGAEITPRAFDGFQPHQVRKKIALAARLRGLAAAGAPVYAHEGLRIDALDGGSAEEEEGTAQRVRIGRFREEMPKGDDDGGPV